ncbi:unnamed protein product [Ectocarpus sp. CCAP 1310/34]|nr:unnamed protein product [Ectocarpus sp. CCAP 1310/34]
MTCRVCGSYLHGLCGVHDPLGDNEMHRVCHRCVNSSNRKESSTDSTAWAASSKRPCPDERATGKEKRAGALGSLKPVGNTARKKSSWRRKPRTTDARRQGSGARPFEEHERRSNREGYGDRDKVRALDLLKSMSGVAIAKDMGIGVSTLYRWRAKEADISKQAAVSMPGAKSTKGVEFAKVE